MHVRVRASSYSEVDAVEQRDVVNSGARGEEDRDLRAEVDCTSTAPIVYPITFKHLALAIYRIGTPGDVAASGSSVGLPRAAAGTRGQHCTLHYVGALA